MSKTGKAGILVLGIVFGMLVASLAVLHWTRPAQIQLNSPFQAVLLDTGQVYYGKLQGAGTDYPVLTDVYYIENKVDAETKAVSNVLVRRGKEWHAPDRMAINARHLVLVEPVGVGSRVAKLIEQYKDQ